MRARFLVLTFALTLAATAFAKPDPALRQLDWMTGKWQCRGTAFANPMTPEHRTEATVETMWEMDGHWAKFAYVEKKTAQNPMPFTVAGWMGYDAEAKKLAMGAVDNMGGYTTAASDGWNGDRIVWNGPWHANGATRNGRDTFIRRNDRELTHTFELEMDGKWVKLSEETCKKN